MALTQEQFKTRVKWGLMGLSVLVIAPITFFVSLGIVGLTAAIWAAAISIFSLGVLNALVGPASQWLTNLKYKALEAVVSRAPIESLYAEQEQSYEDLKQSNLTITEQMTEVEVMRDKVSNFKRTRPDDAEGNARWEARLQEWEKILAFNLELFKEAKTEHIKFGRIIEDAEMDWDMSSTDRKLARSFGKKDDFMRKLRTKTALETVQRESAASRARLKMSLVNNDYAVSQTKDKDPVHAITYDTQGKIVTGNLLNVEPLKVPRTDQEG